MKPKFTIWKEDSKSPGIHCMHTTSTGKSSTWFFSNPPEDIDHVSLCYLKERFSTVRTEKQCDFIKQQFKEQIDQFLTYTNEDAADEARAWCDENKGWKRICDIEETDVLYKTFDELSKKEKDVWIRDYGESAEVAWREFGSAPCKVPYGFITGKGAFYSNVLDVPLAHGIMQVFKVDC